MCKTSPYKIIYTKYTRVSKVKICHKTFCGKKRVISISGWKNNRKIRIRLFFSQFWFGAQINSNIFFFLLFKKFQKLNNSKILF